MIDVSHSWIEYPPIGELSEPSIFVQILIPVSISSAFLIAHILIYYSQTKTLLNVIKALYIKSCTLKIRIFLSENQAVEMFRMSSMEQFIVFLSNV